MSDIEELQSELTKFAEDRNWQQFHTPSNLAKSIAIEAGELLEFFQWEDAKGKTYDIAMEIADIMIYSLMMCHALKIDPVLAIREKIEVNRRRYPIDKCWGSCKKAEEL